MAWAATHTFAVGETLTSNNMNLIQANINAIAAVGTVKFVIASSAGNGVENVWQSGWLELNAAQVSRSTYSSLYTYFNALSPALPFGVGDGSTTFTLPDLQSRSPVHHTVGGHSDMGTLGNNDGTAMASRRYIHKHTKNGTVTKTGSVTLNGTAYQDTAFVGPLGGGSATTIPNTAAGLSISDTTNVSDTITIGVQTSTPTDTVPYIVAGIWVVKF